MMRSIVGPALRSLRSGAARPVIGLLTLLAAAAGLANPAPMPTGALDADTLRRLATRDGHLVDGDPELHHLGRRWVEAQSTAELDGQPPREHIVHVGEYTGEGTWQIEFHPYAAGVDGALPRRLGPPISAGWYRDPGYVRAHDLDGDGRDALLVVGDTSGDSPSALAIWRWDGAAFVDVARGGDPGVDYVVTDLGAGWPADGVVALPPQHVGDDVEAWQPLAFAPLDEGWHIIGLDITPRLPALLERLASLDPPSRPETVLPGLARAMRLAGVRAEPATQRAVEALHGHYDATWQHAAVIRAMHWPGNRAARRHLLRLLDLPSADGIQAAAIEVLASVGTDDDRRALLARLGVEAMAHSPWGQQQLGAALAAFEARHDPRARARLAALVDARALPLETRRWAVIRVLKQHPTAIPDLARSLSRATEPEMVEALIDALDWLTVVDAEHPAWRIDGVAEAIRPLLGHADAGIRRSAIGPALAAASDPSAMLTPRLEAEADPRLLWALLKRLDDVPDGDAGPGRAVAARALSHLQAQAIDEPGHSPWHALIARWGTPGAIAAGLDRAEHAATLSPYAAALPDRPPPAGEPREEMMDVLINRLSPTRPDRVRQAAAQALGAIDDDRARAALVLILRADAMFYVRSAAAESLARRHPEVEEALIVALTQENLPIVRGSIINALGKHGSPKARATLIDRLAHPEDGWAAAHALARVPDAEALEVGRVLAERAATAIDGPNGCEAVGTPLGALARAALAEAEPTLAMALARCPARRGALLSQTIEAWARSEAPGARQALAVYLDDPDRAVSRAAWIAW